MQTFGRDPHFDTLPLYKARFRMESFNRWPPLYDILLVIWAELTGWFELSTRYASLLTGMVTIAMSYRLGKGLQSHSTGVLFAILMGFSAIHLYYMHEARGYTLYVFFTVASVWLYWRYMYRSAVDNWPHRIALFIAFTGVLYVHYIAPATLIFIGLFHLIFAPRGAKWRKVMVIFFLSGVAYCPWIVSALQNILAEREDSRGLATEQLPEVIAYAFSNGMPLLFVLMFAYVARFLRGRPMRFVSLWFIMLFVLAIVSNIFADFLFHIRQIIGLLVPFLLLGAMVLEHLYRRIPMIVVSILMIWIVVGLLRYWPETSQNYLNNIPNHAPGIKYGVMDTMLNTVNTCATSQDTIIVYLNNRPDRPDNVFDILVEYYFAHIPNRHAHVGVMKNFSEAYDLPFLDSYESRANLLLNDAPSTWFLQRVAAPARPYISEFEHIARQNYDYCGQVIEHPDVNGYVYTNSLDFVCGASQITNTVLQPCTTDIVVQP